MKLGAHYLGNGYCEFTVWAPNAETVTVQLVQPEERHIPMQQQAEGYWQATATNIKPGTLYWYQLNQDETRPDPASHFQPQGVHQPSEVIDQAYGWHDLDWSGVALEDLIIYELHVGTFTPAGTFEAIIPRLADLKALGINAIELMPIAQFPGEVPTEEPSAYRNWGYDGVLPFAVQNSYGRPEHLKQLVEACHQHGIAVILDVVYNHFGPEGNYVSQFGPYFTEKYRTPWGRAINFDEAFSPAVRHFFIQNALYWLRNYHIDALRLDAVQAIYDFGAVHFLEELAHHVAVLAQEQGRKLYLIAESDLNDPRLIRPVTLGGYGLDAQWADDFHHSLYALLTGAQMAYYQDYGRCEHLAKAYQDTFVYDWKYAPHRYRFHGRPTGDRPPAQFVVSIQNHDQIANQIPGKRLSQLVSFEALKLAAGAVLLSPYIPLLFMGEEYGEEALFTYFISHADADLVQKVQEGRKQEFAHFGIEDVPADPQAPETFLLCKLNWDKRKHGRHQVLWSFYQQLIQLRQVIPALRKRDERTIEAFSDEASKMVGWLRWNEANQVLCLMNFNSTDIVMQPAQINPALTTTHWRKILDSADQKWAGPGTLASEALIPKQALSLRSQSVVFYEASDH